MSQDTSFAVIQHFLSSVSLSTERLISCVDRGGVTVSTFHLGMGELQVFRDAADGQNLGWLVRPYVCFKRRQMEEIAVNVKDFLSKAKAAADAKPQEFEVKDEDFMSAYPGLYCFLCANSGAEGKPRERASISVFCDGGRWKAMLNDKHSKSMLFATVASPIDAFRALEKLLEGSDPDWRPYRGKR